MTRRHLPDRCACGRFLGTRDVCHDCLTFRCGACGGVFFSLYPWGDGVPPEVCVECDENAEETTLDEFVARARKR